MEIQVFTAFVIATAIMIALPGPSVMLTVAHSISFGWRPALATVTGETLGIAIQLTVAAAGLISLLNTFAQLFEWLRWSGAVYLIYLGIRQWRSKGNLLDLDTSSVSRTNLMLQGLIVTMFNPKSLIFIGAFLPQFIDSTRPAGPQLVIIIPTFLVITYTVTAVWAVSAGHIRYHFRNRKTARSVFKASGGFMVLAGIGLAMARQNR